MASPPDTLAERLRRVLDTLAVLREAEAHLRWTAEGLLNRLAAQGRLGSPGLSLDDRIAGAAANRDVVWTTYRENRPMPAAEQLIWAAVGVATGDSPAKAGAVLARTLGRQRAATDPPVTEATWREAMTGRPVSPRTVPEPEAEAGD